MGYLTPWNQNLHTSGIFAFDGSTASWRIRFVGSFSLYHFYHRQSKTGGVDTWILLTGLYWRPITSSFPENTQGIYHSDVIETTHRSENTVGSEL